MHISRDLEKAPYLYHEAVRAILHIGKVTLIWLGGASVSTSAVAAAVATISTKAKVAMEKRIDSFMDTCERVDNAFDTPVNALKETGKAGSETTKTTTGKKSAKKAITQHTGGKGKTQHYTQPPTVRTLVVEKPRTEEDVTLALESVAAMSHALQHPLDSLAAAAEVRGNRLLSQAIYYHDAKNFDAKYTLLLQSREQFRLAAHKR